MKQGDLDKLKLTRKDGHPTKLALSILLDDEIPRVAAANVRAHLRSCGECRLSMAFLMKVDHAVKPQG
jgi:predicted anti-sigma-YlaC factor YlaD